MIYDYFYCFYDRFFDNGFRKLMMKGVNVWNCIYNYVFMFIGFGYVLIFIGIIFLNYGIVVNDWLYCEFKWEVNCVDDLLVNMVGGSGSIG